MANEPNYYPMTLRRGETRPQPFVYGPLDPAAPRYDISGKSIEMRIAVSGAADIIVLPPKIWLSDPTNGELTVSIPGTDVDAFQFQNANYAILLDGKLLFNGPLTIKSLYE